MQKRILSLILALVMVLGMFPVTAQAGELENGLQYEVYSDHVEITGYTGNTTDVVIPAEIEGLPVTAIGDSAFAYLYSLTSVVIPDCVTFIGDDAFRHCRMLTSISIPEGVTTINHGTFAFCENLTSISIPEGVTSIGDIAFGLCENLTSISIPDGVTFIGSEAFWNCYSLTSISLPDGITSISDFTFSGCSKLTSISIPEGVTSIGDSAFFSCDSLTSISIPEGVTSIGDSAFEDCTGLTSISIPANVACIGDYAFLCCSNLIFIKFNGDAPQFGTDVFMDVTATAFYPAGNPTWTEDVMQDYGGEITWIAQGAHDTHSYTPLVTAPTCTEQGFTTYICSDCSTSYVGDYVDALGHDYADNLCTRCCQPISDIHYLVYEDHVEISGYFGNAAEVIIPAQIEWKPVTAIGNGAFSSCSTLTSVTLPDSVTYIGDNAFSSCTNLTDIELPDSVTYIGNQAFLDCTSLTGISIPNGVTSIGFNTFSFCESLTSISLPDNLSSIGYYAFTDCFNLESVSIPDTVTEIGSGAFNSCYKLTSVTIPGSVVSIGSNAFGWCKNLTTIYFNGDAPQFGEDIFWRYVTAIAFYPAGNPTWTEDVMQDYGGDITWVAQGAHDAHSYTPLVTTPTCTEQGFSTYICACGDSYVGDYVDALGHDFANGICCIRCNLLHESLQYQVYEDHVEITKYTGNAQEIVIPAEIEGLPVTAIGNSAFFNRLQLTNVSLPESITTIGSRAFQGCSYLTSIAIPDGVTTIGEETFADCLRLTSVSLPGSITTIGDYAFCGCCALTDISIPDSVTSIGDYAFGCCESLSSITIPGSVASVGMGAFSGCFGLESITFLGDAPVFGDYVFEFVTTTAYYPAGNATWTEDVKQDYDGDITWVAQQPAHTHEYNAVTTAPTCTEQGFTTYTCACGDSYVGDYVDALGHHYVGGICTRCDEADPDYEEPAKLPFLDVTASDFYFEAVRWAYENGITAGMTDTTFSPNGLTTRGQIVTFLWRTEGCPEPTISECPFVDVAENDYYYDAILWAYENGIAAGMTDTTFSPNIPCNRAQIVTFLWRFAGRPDYKLEENPFTDVSAGQFYYDAVLWAVENDITAGLTSTTFGPVRSCSRAEAVTFLYRFLN